MIRLGKPKIFYDTSLLAVQKIQSTSTYGIRDNDGCYEDWNKVNRNNALLNIPAHKNKVFADAYIPRELSTFENRVLRKSNTEDKHPLPLYPPIMDY